MYSKNISLFFIVAFLTSTSLGLHHLVARAQRSINTFVSRQLNSAACTSVCSSIASTVTSCTSTSCLCTTAIEASIQACIDCAVSEDPSISVVSSAQGIIDTFENICLSVAGIPTVTLNTNPTPTAIVPSTTIIPVTTVSQIVIGPSSTTSAPNGVQGASNIGSTSTISIGGLPLKSSASPNKIILHWTGALLGLAAGILLVF